MWSLGCILGEMLRGQPLFPGTSTVHQLELILETIPPPTEEDLRALGTGYSCTLLHLLGSRRWMTSCHQTPPETPWTSSGNFWCLPPASGSAQPRPCSTPTCAGSTAPAVSGHVRRKCGSRCWKETSSLPPSIAAASTRAIPQIASRMPVGNPGSRPQSSPDGDPEQEASGATRNIPRPSLAPQPQPLPPGRWERSPRTKAEPPCTPPGISSLRGMAPSLTLQAAAQATNQALIRRDWSLNGGLRAAGGRQVSPRPTWEVPEPRPGRRMFGTSAWQGAQGAARAALGGYSQAYGTVCRSALDRLPLLPGPHA
ncbi:mitogen-activated protein kinase 15 isoform X3 [Marmota marmota marmota]|uniref:mitogen-activated protein kinase 15 isoform X3 n=1 Tax=Marmota marmota marmota TaxID=9994 RepID=UPI00209228A7|nr:mitogen-activated protein kinase 15 isoform X3 [Marmota marmota marmota]